jgi:hypothetical protein
MTYLFRRGSMLKQSEKDALVYALDPSIFDSEICREHENRRAVRETFEGFHLVALYHEPPELAKFRGVRCRDISTAGFSYFDDRPPATGERLIVLLGTSPQVCLVGQVAYNTPVMGSNGPEFLIGCQFTGRLRFD